MRMRLVRPKEADGAASFDAHWLAINALDDATASQANELLEKLQPKLAQLLLDPDDVADAVLYAVTQPIRVNVEQIVVRPPKQLNL